MSFPSDPSAQQHEPSGPQPAKSRRGSFATWSLRHQLIVSHVGLATLLILGFGIAIYGMTRRATYRHAEADLLAAAKLFLQDLSVGERTAALDISETYFHRFGPAPRDHAYFLVWDATGRQIAKGGLLPPQAVRAELNPPTHGPHPFLSRTYGTNLDVVLTTPHGGQLLIGRPLAKEFDRLHWLFARLLLIGLVALALGCLGALWLARQITRPLVQMTETAEAISSRDLVRRLNPGETSFEVTRLAIVFNAMLERLQNEFAKQARFTADASHELRTPVSIVLSQAEHTLSRERTAAEYREGLETCLRAARRMRKLVDDLLLLSRADAGQLRLRQEQLDLGEIARGMAELLQPLAAEHQVRLTAQASSVELMGDADRLGQVVTNLVTNALQHSPPGGDVVVEVREEERDAILRVRDRGLGIPLADQPHLFDRFYQVDRARLHGDGTGAGLGLSLVAEIVTAHGGAIEIQSCPGEGTTMTVRLPLRTS